MFYPVSFNSKQLLAIPPWYGILHVVKQGDERILRFIEENKYLLKSRPLCYHHGDYHMGNLIINAGKLWVIAIPPWYGILHVVKHVQHAFVKSHN